MKPFGDHRNEETRKQLRKESAPRRIVSKLPGRRRRVVPDMVINGKRPRTKEDFLDEISNAIDIPEELLDEIKDIITEETETISRIILTEGVSKILAYQNAVEYVSVILRDGLGMPPASVDNDIDNALANALKLRVIQHVMNKMKLPVPVKKAWMSILTRKLAENSMHDPMQKRTLRSSNPDNIVGILRSMNKKPD